MRLEDIGFYTLSDHRAENSSASSRLMRCELLLTARCNFKCPYCRGVGGKDLPYPEACAIVDEWISHYLYAIRFSGGEPTLYANLIDLVKRCKDGGVERIALSTNGSAELDYYHKLISEGVNDISISLDACCAADGDAMAGRAGAWDKTIAAIKDLSSRTYITVGIVFNERNADTVLDTIKFAHDLGVADIRVIPAAQHGTKLPAVDVPEDILQAHPILKYRISNLNKELPVRGLSSTDCNRCGLVLDDIAVCGNKHYPCIIYMREGGMPIGEVGPGMREARAEWYAKHDTQKDPICSKNCLDVCVAYNNKHVLI